MTFMTSGSVEFGGYDGLSKPQKDQHPRSEFHVSTKNRILQPTFQHPMLKLEVKMRTCLQNCGWLL